MKYDTENVLVYFILKLNTMCCENIPDKYYTYPAAGRNMLQTTRIQQIEEKLFLCQTFFLEFFAANVMKYKIQTFTRNLVVILLKKKRLIN